MTTNHDTAQECAGAFERMAESMVEVWHLLLEIPSHVDPKSRVLDDAGAQAASASADILEAGDHFRDGIAGLRLAARKLRAIGNERFLPDSSFGHCLSPNTCAYKHYDLRTHAYICYAMASQCEHRRPLSESGQGAGETKEVREAGGEDRTSAAPGMHIPPKPSRASGIGQGAAVAEDPTEGKQPCSE